MQMEIESRAIELLERIGVSRGQTVIDFGCGYGIYTIPVAKIVGEQGRVYALDKDKEALDALMQKARSACLVNIEKMETSGELEIELADETVDVVIMFDVFHSFYFPQPGDRRRLLDEIGRIMKPSAFLSISVWPNLIGPESEDEIKNTNFHLEKEVPETLTNGSKDLETRIILNYRKARHFPIIAVAHQLMKKEAL
jgi:ubiquinone/menaquinone biosynthesis C-methylase UbiE